MSSETTRFRFPSSGFTLIELLTVIAIIGILAAITIPVVSGVRDSAKKTKTRVQFTQWTAGIRLFKSTYGYYPQFDKVTQASAKYKVNGPLEQDDTTISDDAFLFREVLSGKPAKPKTGGGFEFASDEKTLATAQNKKRRECLTFDIAEITATAGGDAGDADIKVDGAVKDAFGNVEIVVIVDKNNDGFINKDDLDGLTAYPEVNAKGGRGSLSATVIEDRVEPQDSAGVRANGVRAEVIFYSPGRGTSSSSGALGAGDAVWSW